MRRSLLPAVLSVVLLAGCGGHTVVDAIKVPDPGPGSGAVPGVSASEGLQQLRWADCDDGLECAVLSVPVDHEHPTGDRIELAIARLPSTGDDPDVLVTNPGGPGVSGVDYLRLTTGAWSRDVRRAYDVVSFDPRGVGASAPVVCLDDAGMDELLGSDPTPDDEAERAEVDALVSAFVAGCRADAGDLLGHMSTLDVARDMDLLRETLGQDRLNYLGQSWGTHLGSVYAATFPGRTGRMVLDAPASPTEDLAGLAAAQAAGLDATTRAWAAGCVEAGCALGDDVDEVVTGLEELLTRTGTEPLPVAGDGPAGGLTEGWATYGVVAGLVSPTGRDDLTDAVADAVDGDGTALMTMATGYVGRTADGYRGNLHHALHAVNCLDREPGTRTLADEGWAARLGGGPCQEWPVDPVGPVDLSGAADGQPVLVVGTLGDPVTPYPWAVELTEALGNARLLTWEGENHTAYRWDRCVTAAVDAWLVDGMLPVDGATCPA